MKLKFYTIKCEACGWEQVGNDKEFGERVYFDHFLTEHYIDPLISEINEETKKQTRRNK